jgi:hypothetical protein
MIHAPTFRTREIYRDTPYTVLVFSYMAIIVFGVIVVVVEFEAVHTTKS